MRNRKLCMLLCMVLALLIIAGCKNEADKKQDNNAAKKTEAEKTENIYETKGDGGETKIPRQLLKQKQKQQMLQIIRRERKQQTLRLIQKLRRSRQLSPHKLWKILLQGRQRRSIHTRICLSLCMQ